MSTDGWKAEDKIKKLPAFLRGLAASHFYAIQEDDRKTYVDASKGLKEALCPEASRENYFAEFESRMLRPGEDPSVFKWELEQILLKAQPTIDASAKTALLTRQFMRGLPKQMKIKLLEYDQCLICLKCYRSFKDTELLKTTPLILTTPRPRQQRMKATNVVQASLPS